MINNKTVLITRPNDDPILNFLYFWTEEVISEILKKKFDLLDLKGNKANRKNFESYITRNNPNLILLNGHGAKDVVCGQNNEVIVGLHVNDDFLANRIIYSRSCDSALELGANCKAKAFIGYILN